MTLDQAVAHIVELGDAIASIRQHFNNVVTDNLELRQQLRDARAGTANESTKGKSELRSMKASYPDKFKPKNDSFKIWADDFENWMSQESPAAAAYLKSAACA